MAVLVGQAGLTIKILAVAVVLVDLELGPDFLLLLEPHIPSQSALEAQVVQ